MPDPDGPVPDTEVYHDLWPCGPVDHRRPWAGVLSLRLSRAGDPRCLTQTDARPRREAMNQFEREEEQLDQDLAQGRITREEHRKESRALQRDYRAAAEEAARDAYQKELERW